LHEDQEIELEAYVRVLRRRAGTVLWVAVLTVVVAGVLSFFVIKPTYDAHATLIVVNKSTPVIDYNTFILDEQLVQTYASLGTSYGVLERAIRRHHLGYSETRLSQLITVTAVPSTDLVTVDAKAPSPREAARLANDVAASLAAQARSATPGYNVSVVDAAVPPSAPASPNKKLNLVLGLLLGLVLGTMLAFLQERLDRTIHDAEQLAQEIGVPVLATVPVIEPVRARDVAAARRVAKRETLGA
jgi:capsular polysaccharide biosynthesis protein